jgi:hypothetical protein
VSEQDRATAERLVSSTNVKQGYAILMVGRIAAALDAARQDERERCAKVADEAALNAGMSDCYDVATHAEVRTAKSIAAAIRAGGTP